ncbi:MAG: hypothetical protein KDA05_09790, partial [Phycisphaerales bacterium]|nr:hypothetical protein [Phycisphaerales bacterium]
LSNPPIFSPTPLKASLDLFDRAGVDRLREKSVAMTGYLEDLLGNLSLGLMGRGRPGLGVLTPTEPEARGCQLSIVVPGASREVQRSLLRRGVVCDFREPNVIRAAPVPLYCSFHDVWRFVRTLGEVLA